MHKSVLLLACAPLLLVSLGAGAVERCRYSAPRNAELDATGLRQLSVEIGADSLAIHGVPGATKIVVHGTACASNQDWLHDVQVQATRQGDIASIIAHDRDRGIHIALFGSSYAYLKLDVAVPESLAVKLQQGSGDAVASRLAALDARLGSGDLKVDTITGGLGLAVGSGDALAMGVGSLDLASVASGDASVDGVHGNARVGSVGSGDVVLGNVSGSVAIGSVGSGEVTVKGVGGAVKVGSIGSGDAVIHDAKGDVSIDSIASGDASVARAGGNVHAGSVGSGGFGALDVGGDFSVGAVGSGDIRHRNVKGKVSIPQRDD